MRGTTRWLASAGLFLMATQPVSLHAGDEWSLLGTRKVSRAAEKDVIEVGQRDGKFRSIRIDVNEGTIEIYNIRVLFVNGEDFSPETRLVFREGERSRVIDLPGEARSIRRIEFAYRNTEPRGEAIVSVYGRESGPSNPEPGGGDGWEAIGARQVDFHADHDLLVVAGKRAYRRLMFQVEGADLEMFNVKVTFANGESFSPDTRLHFDANTRSRAIDLPGSLRDIQRIAFFYRSTRRGEDGKATVRVFGRK